MKNLFTVSLLFFFLLLTVQAEENWSFLSNYLQRVYKKTHITTSLPQITKKDKDYEFKYGAGLSWGDGENKWRLFDFGVSLGWQPDVNSFNLTFQNASFKYNANLVLNNDTNVTLSGQAGIENVIDANYDLAGKTANISLRQSITDSNSFVARNATTLTTSRNTQSFSLNTTVNQKNDVFKLQSNGSYGVQARGTVTNGTTSLGAFTLIDSVNATTNQTIDFYPTTTSSSGSWWWNLLTRYRRKDRTAERPKIGNVAKINGKSGFNVSTSYNFQNTLTESSLNGTATNTGYIARKGDDVILQTLVNYNTVRDDRVNGSLLNNTKAQGIADTKTTWSNYTEEDDNGNFFANISNITQIGSLIQNTQTNMYNASNQTQKPKLVKNLMTGSWVASHGTVNRNTSETTNDVNTTSSFKWLTKTYQNVKNQGRGCLLGLRHFKPTIESGNPTLATAFKTTTTSSSLQDLEIHLFQGPDPRKDPKFGN